MVDLASISAYTSGMFQFITFPTWISPYVIPGLPIRWYSMMYLVAFTITFLLFVHQIKHKEIDYTIDDTLTLFLYTIAGLILARAVVLSFSL